MHTTLKAVTAAMLGLALLAPPATAETTTLKVWATPSIFKPMFEGFVNAFEAENPNITIELDASERAQEDMVQTILRQAIVGDLPDVSFQGFNFLRTVAERGITVPLEEFIANDPDWSDNVYSSSVTESGGFRGRVHGLGVGFSFPVLFYNADLVRQVQGNATFPDTWDGILELASDIGELDEDVIGGFHGFHPWFFQAQINSRGGTLMNAEETAVTFDGPEGQATMELVHRFAEAGQARTPMSRSQARQAFAGGTIGILIDSSSGISQRAEQIGDNFELGIARLPILADNGRIPAAGIAVTMSAKDAEKQAVAWEFMKFVVGVAGQEIVAENTSYVPANAHALAESEALRASLEHPLLQPVVETAPYATSWYAFPGANAAKINNVIATAVEDVATLRQDPDEALNTLQRDVEALLAN